MQPVSGAEGRDREGSGFVLPPSCSHGEPLQCLGQGTGVVVGQITFKQWQEGSSES